MAPLRSGWGLLLAVVAQGAPAQSVWIVDRNNPVGAHFSDLPPALAAPAVVDGDVLVLRSFANYSSAATSKGVSIVAPSGAVIGSAGGPGTSLAIGNLPPGTQLTLRNVTVIGLPRTTPLGLTSCAGTVHLDGVTIPGNGLPVQNPGTPGLICTGCSAVTVQGCSIAGKPAVSASNSSLCVTSSTLDGISAGLGDQYVSPSGAGLVAVQSHVEIGCSAVTGGNGTAGPQLLAPGNPAVIVTSGSLRLGGIAGTASCRAGLPASTEKVAAMYLWNGMAVGSVAIDPRVPLVPQGGAQAIEGGPANAVRTVAALAASRTPIGVNTTVIRRPGDLAGLLGGFCVPPLDGPLGRIWLDPGRVVWLGGAAVLDATGGWTTSLAVPSAAPLGLPIVVQGLVLSATALEATTATAVVLGT